MTKKQNRSFGFGKRTLSVVLAVLLILSTMAVMLTVTSLSADAAISYWFVSGSMNSWTTTATSANKINSGTGGSVTIEMVCSPIVSGDDDGAREGDKSPPFCSGSMHAAKQSKARTRQSSTLQWIRFVIETVSFFRKW